MTGPKQHTAAKPTAVSRRTRLTPHHYVRRSDRQVVTERLLGDSTVDFLYTPLRERARWLFEALTSRQASRLLGLLCFDLPLAPRLVGQRRFLNACGVDLSEAVDPETLDTPRKIFERRIRYWDCRPMPDEPDAVVAPADARVVVGSLRTDSQLFVKDKFFAVEELFGRNKPLWLEAFRDGDWAIFRLTPDLYHYNHTPVAGVVTDFYEISGRYHACNPGAVVQVVTPYSKNKRVVTVINTDVGGGSGVGLVAMIEVVALMVGDVVQCYSAERYADPQPLRAGMFLARGAPKSRYHPGSSTDVLIFQEGRIRFAADLLANQLRTDVPSRFSLGFAQPLVETEVKVRSLIARRREEVAES
jgi:phosphatidylserine decarboxylase